MSLNKKILGVVFGTILTAGSLIAAGHSTTINWTASVDMPATIPAGSGYNVFRASGACPASGVPTGAAELNTTPVAANTFTDTTVTPGNWCYYVETLLGGVSSLPSNTALGATPVAPPTNVTITTEQ